jgi:hypothetical protein
MKWPGVAAPVNINGRLAPTYFELEARQPIITFCRGLPNQTQQVQINN